MTNSLFVLKYAGRSGVAFAAAIYFIVFLGIARYFTICYDLAGKFLSRRILLLFLVFVSLLAFLAVYCLPENSRVARLPAISEWISHLLNGDFPYGGPMNPSGFPILFLLAVPVYYLGNIGLLEVIGIFLFGIVIIYDEKNDVRAAWYKLFILMLLPIVYYEVITRSELFFNMSLALALVVVTDKYLNEHEVGTKFFVFAIGFGLVLSTRLIVAPLYAIFVIHKFKGSLAKGLVFSSTVILAFALTLLPFLIWNSSAFISDGPFRLQFAYLPKWGAVAALLASVILGFASREIKDVSSFAGMTIFGTVALAFIWALCQIGFKQVVSRDGFDIGYFILSVPFLLFGLNLRCDAKPSSAADLARLESK